MADQIIQTAFEDIRSRIVGAGIYPFRPSEIVTPRLPYAHSFVYIKSGKGIVTIDGNEYQAKPHDLFYFEPGIVHSYIADSEEPMVHASVYVDLLWNTSPKLKGDKGLNEHRLEKYDPQLSTARIKFIAEPETPVQWPPAVQTSIPAQADWLEAFLSVIHHFDSNDFSTAIWLRSLFETFLVGFVRFLAHPYVPTDPRIRRIIAWMQTNMTSDFQPAVWANSFHISEAYLYELFRKETGNSPQQYFMSFRLEQAKTELRETNLSVTDIADKLGFSSVHYFSRQFSKHLHESPNQYRKRVRLSIP
ncbi:AraC family transcriptional regulator [Paenibacillus albus]|nr:AraC family transcriptional regulator [Paenibacillus albus]